MSERLQERLAANKPKRILSLDGGGVMGLISLGYLERLETVLRERHAPSAQEDFRLCDYFDLIGGTSTGAIIGSLLALGLKAAEIKRIYLELCPKVFSGPGVGVITSKYNAQNLQKEIQRILREIAVREGTPKHDFPLDTPLLRTGLAIVCKRLDTDSVWVQTNIPGRRYLDPAESDWAETDADSYPNRNYLLGDLIRASAAAPSFLPPVLIPVSHSTGVWSRKKGAFVDGGASPHNNPSKELFLMAALRGFSNVETGDGPPPTPYGLGWETGAKNILMISIGAGRPHRERSAWSLYHFSTAIGLGVRSLRSMMSDCDQDAVTWMQALSQPPDPKSPGRWPVDRNLDDMANMRLVKEPLLSFQRYQASLRKEDLVELMGKEWVRSNLGSRRLKQLQKFDNGRLSNLYRLDEIGVEAAAQSVSPAHLPPEFDV